MQSTALELKPGDKFLPEDKSLLDLFARQVQKNMAAPAVECRGEILTYGELDRRSNQLAHYLRRLGIGKETPVGVLLPRSLDLVVALLGIIKAGGAYVPLDTNYPQERLDYILADSQAPVLLVMESTQAFVPEYSGRMIALDAEAGQIALEDENCSQAEIDLENIAYLIYTSGSTGRPKSVMIRHHSVLAFLYWVREVFTDEDLSGVLASTSICFDVSVFEIFGTLCWGGRTVIINNALDVDALSQVSGLTLICVVPSAMAELLRLSAVPDSVKIANLGGEALASSLARQVYQSTNIERVYNLYGPSEDTTYTSFELVGRNEQSLIVPIGVPLPGTDLYILNGEMEPVPAGETGELYIGGDGLSRGYLNRPDLTAERFVPHLFSGGPGSRLYYTGDRVRRLPDGRFAFLGRVDHQVKIRGYRVELEEIETILRGYSGIEQAAARVWENPPGQKRLVAYVVGEHGNTITTGELRRYAQQKLPDYMVPSQFVVLERLPLTPNGKIDRHGLPEPGHPEADWTPETEMEMAVAQACCQVLNLPAAPLNSTFFELGGSSLNATRVIAAIRELTSLAVPLNLLFSEKTLREIAREIEEQKTTVRPAGLELKRRAKTKEAVPAAYSQERIWFIQRMDPANRAYHFAAKITFSGRLNKAALERALSRFVERHEIYRTTLAEIEGNLFQIVHDPWKIELEIADAESHPHVAEQVFEEMQRPFDLAALPLARWKLIRLSSQEHALLVVEHHIIHDGWSFNVFMGELTELYRSYDRDEPVRLNPSPFQFADFSLWQREWMETSEAREQLEYWARELADAPPLLLLPYDHRRPALQSYRGDVLRFRIDEELERALAAAIQRNHVTLFMLFAAAFDILLYRYSHQEDFCIGTGIANRRWAETGDMTGMLVNNIPLRARIGGNLTISEILEQVKKTTLAAYANQDVPFDKIVQAVNPVRDPGYNPVFQVMLGFHDSPLNCAPLEDTKLIVEQALANGSAKFDLNVVVIPPQNHNVPPGYTVRRELLFEYNQALFSPETAQQMAGHFLSVLKEVTGDVTRKIWEIPLLSATEQRQIIVEWNRTSRPYPQECVHQIFELQAERTPEAIAVVYGRQKLTYAELNQQANQLAHYLNRIGARPESLIGIFMERGPQMVIATLAVLKAGAAYVPLDRSYPPERLRFMMNDAAMTVLLTEENVAPEITESQCGLHCINVEAERQRIAHESAADPECLINNAHLAYVMYTSGSTGTPKGIAIEHRNIVRLVKETGYVNLGPTDRIAQVANASFDAATFEIWGALLNGGCLVGIDKHTALNPLDLGNRIREEKITAMFLTVALFNQIIREVKSVFAGVRYLLVGGEAMDPHYARLVLQDGPPAKFMNVYGPTEATTFSTYFVIKELEEGATTVPIGHPLTNAQTYVLDQWFQPVPPGVSGELFIGGDGIGRSYLNRPELTAEKFIPDAFSQQPGRHLYRTGDLVRQLRDGNLDFIARIDHQIKLRGFRVELGEIEAVLGRVEGIAQCAVSLREDEPGEKRLVAYVASENNALLNTAELRAHLKSRLPEYMVPSACVQLPALPLTANGKINRQALPSPQYRSETHRVPRTPQEEILGEIFAGVLSLERVGIDDNFFDLGGHSLMATRVVSRVRSMLGLELSLRAFFEAPTVAGLAAQLGNAEKASVPLAREQRPERLPLSYPQQRLWFLDQLQGASTEYNMLEALHLRGELDRSALEQAVSAIVERHEVLRTHFAEVEGRPVQIIQPKLRIRVPVEDLGGFSAAAQTQRIEAAMWQEREQPFDLARGPLLRFKLFRLGEQEHVLLRTFHHIISDGWSQGIFNRELALLYDAFRQGRPNPLEPLPVQYADFALWQRQWLDEQAIARDLDYWKQQLAGIPAQLELPRDRPRPPRQTFAAGMHRAVLPAEQVKELKAVAQAGQATVYMTLLAVFAVLLERYSGQQDIVVGSPVANRQEAQLESLIGFFTNSLVMRTQVQEEESFRELLRQVRETALAAYAHQDLPFERLVEELSPERSLNATPIYQVVLALQNASFNFEKIGNLQAERIKSNRLTVRFDLEVHAWERDGHIEFNWVYNPDLFDPWRIEQMARHYLHLLLQVPNCAVPPLASMELLYPEEQSQILLEWNRTGSIHPGAATIHELFERQVERTPHALAVTDQQQSFTYAQLNDTAERFAVCLRNLGVGPEIRVGVCVKRSALMVASLLGILKAGGAYVPLDPEYPSDRIAFMLQDSQAAMLLTEEEFLPQLSFSSGRTVILKKLQQESAKLAVGSAAEKVLPENLAYVIYTSGSTGTPKGIAIRHSSAVTMLEWGQQTFPPSHLHGILASTSLCFDMSIFEIFAPLSCGGAVLVVRNALQLAEMKSPEWLAIINTVPSAMRELLRLNAVPASIKTVNLGGEPLPAELVMEIYGLKHVEHVFNLYGPSEDTTYSTFARVERAPKDGRVLIGKPLSGTRVYVVNAQMKPVPAGVAGELYIGGAGLARGYLDRPALTAERFIPDPLSNTAGERLYRTGDLVRWRPDGALEFLGRTDFQVKIRGFRVEPEEIAAVLKKHASVQDALVIAREDHTGGKQLAGYVVLFPGAPVDMAELRHYLRQSLPEYMVPASIVALAEWPLTPNGKIDRRALPTPEQRNEEYRAPHTPEEEILCRLFAEVLGLERVGIDDNFFHLGGHSLMATLLVSRIRTSFGINLAVGAIFETPTVIGLASSLAFERQPVQKAAYADTTAVKRK